MATTIQVELGQFNQNLFPKSDLTKPSSVLFDVYFVVLIFLELSGKGEKFIYPTLIIITSFRKEFLTHIYFKHTISIISESHLNPSLRCQVRHEKMSFSCRDDYFLHLMHYHPFNLYSMLEIALQGRVGKTPVVYCMSKK